MPHSISFHKFALASLLGLSLLGLTGCATSLNENEIADPLEGLNRAVYGVNEAADILFIGPASTIYHEGMPEPVQGVVRNFFRNLEMPVIAINKLLQGNVDGFGTAVGRFFVNTIAGVGGLADIATNVGLPYEDTDFGITLASWGMDPAFYLVLPVIGPSSLRDGIGRGVEWYADPVRLAAHNNDYDSAMFGVSAARVLDTRATYDAAISDTRTNTLDTYAAWRSLYSQRRAAEINKQLGPGH
jgi:phospholipid-binding lipoprotein MlaA